MGVRGNEKPLAKRTEGRFKALPGLSSAEKPFDATLYGGIERKKKRAKGRRRGDRAGRV